MTPGTFERSVLAVCTVVFGPACTVTRRGHGTRTADRPRGDRPGAGIDAAHFRGHRHRPAAGDDALVGFLLRKRVARPWLPRHVRALPGKRDRCRQPLAVLAGIEP